MSRRILCTAVLVAFVMIAGGLEVMARNKNVTRYQDLSPEQRTVFVNEQLHRLAREISGRDYDFTPEFVVLVQNSVDSYARRAGNGRNDPLGKADVNLVIERGQKYAPTLATAFKVHNLSPLFGLYIPFIESEFMNIASPNEMGAVGMFQFLPRTGADYGLTRDELLDVEKSADAAARYILDSVQVFKGDLMSEALAVLAYNRGGGKVVQELQLTLNMQNRNCSICALSAAKDRLDKTFREESVYYVPLFFAAAIVGENPQAFGLKSQPLSWYANP